MNPEVEIDKAGRIVIPKKLREAMHLVPGTRLSLSQDGEALILRQESAAGGLYKKHGLWVNRGTSSLSIDEARALIEVGREQREHTIVHEDSTS